MDGDNSITAVNENENKNFDIVYSPEKDFYKGMGGELRFKAEGLFKKAKEKGISIEDINITTLKENQEEFPGLGLVELPTYIVQVKGKHVQSGQVIVDGKQIDYFNRYKKYVAERIENKNVVKDERGKKVREYGKYKIKDTVEFTLSDWDMFEVGKSLIEDKEFGLEKTITGACDRVIRKLMGENDWLYPDEVRLLDEEYNTVQEKISKEQDAKRQVSTVLQKKATERQINYFKAKVKTLGLDPDNNKVMKEILKNSGFESMDINDLSTGDMSKIIDGIGIVAQRIKDSMVKQHYNPVLNPGQIPEPRDDIKQ